MPRPKGSPNKITAEIKERLSQVIMDAMSSGTISYYAKKYDKI